MARAFSYVVKRDYGFAPNPFYGFLTLATCKPLIRKNAEIGDFIIGNSPSNLGSKLVYMAKVSEIITFDEYWTNSRFLCKRPIMNGSIKKLYGDNIYHHAEDGTWMQENSHHSLKDGSINKENLDRDTSHTDRVLIANDYFYFGKDMIEINEYADCLCNHIGQDRPSYERALKLWEYLCSNYEMGLIALPRQFKEFVRYDGHS